jgi:DNA-binding transcriptional regulator YiaG
MTDLRTLRQSAGLTQAQAAALLETNLRTYEGWEAGRGGKGRVLAGWLLSILTRQDRTAATARPD